MTLLLLLCLVVFGVPIVQSLLAGRAAADGGVQLPRLRRFARIDIFRPRAADNETVCVVDEMGRTKLAVVSHAVHDAVTGSLQRTKFLAETYARSEAWALLAAVDIYAPLEQYRAVIERDAAAGIRQFAAEHRHGAIGFRLDNVIADPDLMPGELRVVPALEAKARFAAIKQAERNAKAADEHRVRVGADGEPRLVRTTGEGSDVLPLRLGSNEIGRHPGHADRQLLVMTVSRHHAIIEIDDCGRATIRDEGSAHGTYVDGARVMPDSDVPLPHRAEVRFGTDAVYRFEAGSIGFIATSR